MKQQKRRRGGGGDFYWISQQDRSEIYCSLMHAASQGRRGTPYEYTLLMPPLRKAHQFLSRDERHRKWNGYIWENV